MTPEEIRSSYRDEANKSQTEYLPCVIVYALAEIAAQLAELNQNIQFLMPTNQEIQHRAVELDIEEIEQIKEQRRKAQEILSQPTSDPEQFVRCSSCLKEVLRPEWCEVGKTITCDDCIPF